MKLKEKEDMALDPECLPLLVEKFYQIEDLKVEKHSLHNAKTNKKFKKKEWFYFTSKSKEENILPMGFTDNAKLKKDIKKDELISLNDVDLNLEKEIIEAREYQNNLIS